MKKNKYFEFIVVIILVFIYFLSSKISYNNYILFQDKVYKLNGGIIEISDKNVANNKKISIYTSTGIISGYYKVDDSYSGAKFHSENGEIIHDYYYGYFGKINISKFSVINTISSSNMIKIREIVRNDLEGLNYNKTISIDSNEEIYFLGNFNDDSFYEIDKNNLDDKVYYEYIVYKDSNNNYSILDKKEVNKDTFKDTTFYLFKSFLSPTKNDKKYMFLTDLNYSNVDYINSNLYLIDDKLTAIGGDK